MKEPTLTKGRDSLLRSNYKDSLTQAMTLLAKDKRTIFLGQSVAYSGNAVYHTLKGVPLRKRIEMPVAEDMQMGMSIGLSLQGYIPVSIYPRFDFLILAMNQLVNHLDKCAEMTNGEFKPKVIIRTVIGSTKPLYPGVQHCQDYTDGLVHILKNVEILELTDARAIVPAYKWALDSARSTILIENGGLYYGRT